MDKKIPGYVYSKHIFGRSELIRNGNELYYLKWQWNKHKDFSNIITLTAKQYSDIKKLLLKVKKEKVTELSVISNTITYYHSVSSPSYMRVKRYLKKHKLIKE